MSSVASAAVLENKVLVKDRRRRKFTPENIARIKDWVAQGVGRDEIANRLEVTVGSLQVTCSKLGISLRRSAFAKGSGAVKPHEHSRRGDHAAKFALLIQAQNRRAAIDLPLSQDVIDELALEAAVRGQTIPSLVGKIISQVMEANLVGELLHNGNSPSKA